MACNTLTGIAKGCENNIGGIQKFYVVNFDHVTATFSNGEIIAMSTATYSFVEFEFNKNSSSYVEEGVMDLVNGSTVYTTTTNLVIPRREVAKRNSLQLLAAGQQSISIVIKDQNGLFWLQGWENGANLTAQGEGSGVVKLDGSKYSLTFISEERYQMPEVQAAVITSLGLS